MATISPRVSLLISSPSLKSQIKLLYWSCLHSWQGKDSRTGLVCPMIQILHIYCTSQALPAPPCSVLEFPHHVHFSLPVNPNRLELGDLLKMEQTDTEAAVSFACKKTYYEFLTLSCLKVSIFKGEQKDLK